MCTRYWNLKAPFRCPSCGAETQHELQTHWLGDDGSCLDHYAIGEKVWELRGIKLAILDGSNDTFLGRCTSCDAYVDFGARIEDEAVVEVWPLSYHHAGGNVVIVS